MLAEQERRTSDQSREQSLGRFHALPSRVDLGAYHSSVASTSRMETSATAPTVNDEEEEDIYADMPPLEGFSEPSTSPRLELQERTSRLRTALEQSATDLLSLNWVSEPERVNRTRAQDEALERLRGDASFRARVQQYMQPETANRILRVLDRSADHIAHTQAQAQMQAQPPASEQVPGSPHSDARARWELSRGLVDGNGDFVTKRPVLRFWVGR